MLPNDSRLTISEQHQCETVFKEGQDKWGGIDSYSKISNLLWECGIPIDSEKVETRIRSTHPDYTDGQYYGTFQFKELVASMKETFLKDVEGFSEATQAFDFLLHRKPHVRKRKSAISLETRRSSSIVKPEGIEKVATEFGLNFDLPSAIDEVGILTNDGSLDRDQFVYLCSNLEAASANTYEESTEKTPTTVPSTTNIGFLEHCKLSNSVKKKPAQMQAMSHFSRSTRLFGAVVGKSKKDSEYPAQCDGSDIPTPGMSCSAITSNTLQDALSRINGADQWIEEPKNGKKRRKRRVSSVVVEPTPQRIKDNTRLAIRLGNTQVWKKHYKTTLGQARSVMLANGHFPPDAPRGKLFGVRPSTGDYRKWEATIKGDHPLDGHIVKLCPTSNEDSSRKSASLRPLSAATATLSSGNGYSRMMIRSSSARHTSLPPSVKRLEFPTTTLYDPPPWRSLVMT